MEIKAVTTMQRVREGGSRIRNGLSNGPRRAQSNEEDLFRVFCDVWHTSHAGDMKVFHKVHEPDRESRWHRGLVDSPLTEIILFLSGALFIARNKNKRLREALASCKVFAKQILFHRHLVSNERIRNRNGSREATAATK